MFSKRFIFLILTLFFVSGNLSLLAVTSREAIPAGRLERLTIALIAPFQTAVSRTADAVCDTWTVYFASASAARETARLKKALDRADSFENQCRELQLENERLRRFIHFKADEPEQMVASRVIARDPSPWFRTMMIDKGSADGIVRGVPVLADRGVVGQVVAVSGHYSRVSLITDRNSSVDALVQSTRARGIVQGNNTETCDFNFALRKEVIRVGDDIVSSGLDQVYPKGLSIGEVISVTKDNSELFQVVQLRTSVDFDTLEEVLVLIRTGNIIGEEAQ